MNKYNTGSTSLVISIVVVLGLIGGGIVYYKNSQSPSTKSTDTQNTINSEEAEVGSMLGNINIGSTSPTDIMLNRTNGLLNSQSFNAMIQVTEKYDSKAMLAKAASQYQNADTASREKFAQFVKALLPKTEEMTNIKETITGDTALVTAKVGVEQVEASFIREGGSWKLDKFKTLLVGE